MKTLHKQIIEEGKGWYDGAGRRKYYEINNALVKVENGFMYIFDENIMEWDLQEPKEVK